MFLRHSFLLACGLIAATPVILPAIQIMADTNRDGAINSSLDEAGKGTWQWSRGAVFLNNCDSDSDNGEPDHADSVVNGANDFQDLTSILLLRDAALNPASTVTLSVSSAASPYVRLFKRTGPTTAAAFTPGVSGNISTAEVIAGDVELLIEANSFATASWNGKVTVTVTTQPPVGSPVIDSVELRVAPWLLLSNLKSASEVYLREYVGQNDVMKAQLQAALPIVGATLVVCPGTAPYPSNNVWMQDAMEIGYTEKPGHRMNVVLKSNRGPSWPLSNYPKDTLLSPNYGWFQHSTYSSTRGSGNAPDGWLDWFGNLEVTPPIPGYPYGRVYYGQNPGTGNSLDPAIVSMINAQELQGPALPLDVGWLLIKHVDEIFCWVPTSSGGQKLLVPDTTLMYNLLDSWVTSGYGSQPMLRVYNSTETVSAFRNATSFRTANLNLQTNRINPVIEAAKTAWGLTEADIIRIPAAYYSNGGSYVPNMVNSLVLNGTIIVPEPHGPVLSGTDLLQQDFRNRLANAGVSLTVSFVDDQRYHKWSGNVHCATNAKREGFNPSIWSTLSPSTSLGEWSEHTN
jgi:protein-arginine deiminase